MATQGRKETRVAGRWLAGLLLMTVLAGCGRAPAPRERVQPAPDPVQVQLDAMRLEEKLGQLVLIGLDGQALDEPARDLIQAYHVGGVIL